VFYLGSDRRSAELEADALKARWRWFRMQGHDVWPEGEPDRLGIRTALGLEVGAPTPNLAQGRASDSAATDQPVTRPVALCRPSPPIKAVRGGLSLDFAARLYVAHQEERHRSGEISPRHLGDIKRRIRRITDFVGDSTPLAAIDSTRLRKFVKQVRFDEGFAISYAGNLVNQFRWLLDWASKDDRCVHAKPHDFDTALVIQKNRLRTDAEHKAAEAEAFGDVKKFFTPEQIALLLKHADDRMKLCILLGLNCGFYPSDIGSLRLRHVKRDGVPRIEKIRAKTGVPGRWELWPETFALIDRVYTPNADELIVLSDRGKAIATDRQNYLARLFFTLRSDVRVAVKKKGGTFECPEFKFLRHTAANAIKEVAGSEVSETFLAHKELLKLQSTYTARLWGQVGEALKRCRPLLIQ
jgi:integrase